MRNTSPALLPAFCESVDSDRRRIEGLCDLPHPGALFQEPRAAVFALNVTEAGQLYGGTDRHLRVEGETVGRHLKETGIVLSRPDPEYVLKRRRLKRHAMTSERLLLLCRRVNPSWIASVGGHMES